jgi:hypothetical protein
VIAIEVGGVVYINPDNVIGLFVVVRIGNVNGLETNVLDVIPLYIK